MLPALHPLGLALRRAIVPSTQVLSCKAMSAAPRKTCSVGATLNTNAKSPKVVVYSYKKYDSMYLVPLLEEVMGKDQVKYITVALSKDTAPLAAGCDAVCLFVNDKCDAATTAELAGMGVRLVLNRCAGFNNVDLEAAEEHNISVRRVPSYSPHAVAEMAVALLLAVVRKIHRAYSRVREHNFSIAGLEGFNIHGKTIGIIGTGNIGTIMAGIMKGFGPSHLLAYDTFPSDAARAMGVEYVSLQDLCKRSDIISLHLPLFPETYHIINETTLCLMKPNVVIINTSRGALVDAVAIKKALKLKRIGGLAMDVYENESSYFFQDCSDQIMDDHTLSQLLTYPNVIITAHQAFLTKEALEQIGKITVQNFKDFNEGLSSSNEVKPVKKLPNQGSLKSLVAPACPSPSGSFQSGSSGSDTPKNN